MSGGCVEGAVVEVAERGAARAAEPRLLHFGIADSEAWDVGLPCGGEIDVFVERIRAVSLRREFARSPSGTGARRS